MTASVSAEGIYELGVTLAVPPPQNGSVYCYVGDDSLDVFTANHTADTAVPDHGVILLYHYIAQNTPIITSINPADFEAQMQYLNENNFPVWQLV